MHEVQADKYLVILSMVREVASPVRSPSARTGESSARRAIIYFRHVFLPFPPKKGGELHCFKEMGVDCLR